MPNEINFPHAARGTFAANEDFAARGDHLAGFNNAIADALATMERTPEATYQVTFVLSATVVEEHNPGRISEYIATAI